jgi:flagellar hook protein FlgE
VDTELNDLLQVTTNLSSGDLFNIDGTASDGSVIAATFTYGVDGTTVGALVNTLNDAYDSGSEVTIVDGKLTITDLATGNSDTTISITADSANVGDITVPSFANSTEGYTAEVSTSIVIYDSLGESHTLTINFVKGEENGEWTWDITCSGDEVISSGGTGKVFFDDNGEFIFLLMTAGSMP